MKQISGKRQKTDADHLEMARIEFLASLYLSADGPIIPASNIDAMLVNAAKKSKEGQSAKSAVFCIKHAQMIYDGPRSADELWEDERFRDRSPVRVQNARVMRTRPKFDQWSAVVELSYEPTLINVARIDDWMLVAGTQIGLGDWRPQHGRFDAERVSV